MASPFVYQPTTPVEYTAYQFANTPYTRSPRPVSPFIPDFAAYPPSPYSRPPSLNASPNRRPSPLPSPDLRERYAFPTNGDALQPGYDGFWDNRRERRPSWHGVNQDPWSGAPPPLSAPLNNFGNPASFAAGTPFYPPRRHSFSSASRPSFESLSINPLLNAEAPPPGFFFDLSRPKPEPLYNAGGRPSLVPPETLAQPATSPLLTRLRVVSDALPGEWAIDLALPEEVYENYLRQGYEHPPINVWDVLQTVHKYMQLPISHSDWARLSRAEMENVTRAFTRRCRAASGGYDGYDVERAKGVKRVDYLGGETRFVGLLKAGREDGWETVKLVTTDPSQPA